MKCRWHVFEHYAGNSFWTRSLMVWGAAEGLLEDGWRDLANQHRDRGGRGWSNVVEPWEWYSRRECRVRR